MHLSMFLEPIIILAAFDFATSRKSDSSTPSFGEFTTESLNHEQDACFGKKDGDLPAGSCVSEYFSCVGNRKISRRCRHHLVYNPKRQKCVHSLRSEQCPDFLAPTTAEPVATETIDIPDFDCSDKDNALYAHPDEQCSPFYFVCHAGVSNKMRCAAPLYFDVDLQSCDSFANIESCSGTKRTSPIPEEAFPNLKVLPVFPFSCLDKPDGVYPDIQSNCSRKFYICSNGFTNKLTCSGRLYFNPSLKRCELYNDIFECTGEVPLASTTPTWPAEQPFQTIDFDCTKLRDGIYPDDQAECSNRFLICSNGVAWDHLCPDFLYFDPNTKHCMSFGDTPICKEKTSTPDPDDILNPISNFNCFNKLDGIHANELESCSDFYFVCSNNVAQKVKCPESLFFDSKLKICDTFANIDDCSHLIKFNCTSKLDGNYENPENSCSGLYYSCSGERAKLRECSTPNIFYDKKYDLCDSKENIPVCGGKRKPLRRVLAGKKLRKRLSKAKMTTVPPPSQPEEPKLKRVPRNIGFSNDIRNSTSNLNQTDFKTPFFNESLIEKLNATVFASLPWISIETSNISINSISGLDSSIINATGQNESIGFGFFEKSLESGVKNVTLGFKTNPNFFLNNTLFELSLNFTKNETAKNESLIFAHFQNISNVLVANRTTNGLNVTSFNSWSSFESNKTAKNESIIFEPFRNGSNVLVANLTKNETLSDSWLSFGANKSSKNESIITPIGFRHSENRSGSNATETEGSILVANSTDNDLNEPLFDSLLIFRANTTTKNESIISPIRFWHHVNGSGLDATESSVLVSNFTDHDLNETAFDYLLIFGPNKTEKIESKISTRHHGNSSGSNATESSILVSNFTNHELNETAFNSLLIFGPNKTEKVDSKISTRHHGNSSCLNATEIPILVFNVSNNDLDWSLDNFTFLEPQNDLELSSAERILVEDFQDQLARNTRSINQFISEKPAMSVKDESLLILADQVLKRVPHNELTLVVERLKLFTADPKINFTDDKLMFAVRDIRNMSKFLQNFPEDKIFEVVKLVKNNPVLWAKILDVLNQTQIKNGDVVFSPSVQNATSSTKATTIRQSLQNVAFT